MHWRYIPTKTINGLYFGMLYQTADQNSMNKWVREEVKQYVISLSRAVKVVAPDDDSAVTADDLLIRLFCSLEVYHIYVSLPNDMNPCISQFMEKKDFVLLLSYCNLIL